MKRLVIVLSLLGGQLFAQDSGLSQRPAASGGVVGPPGPGVSFPLLAPQGVVGAPSYSWVDDPDSGWYQEFANQGGMSFAVNGVRAYRIGNTYNLLSYRNGSASFPAFGFDFAASGLYGLGMYASGTRVLEFATDGVSMLKLDKASGNGTVTLGLAAASPPTLIRVGGGGTLGTATLGTANDDGFSFPSSGLTAIYSATAVKSTFTAGAGQTVEFQLLTVADNGGGTAAAATLTATNNVVKVVCNDADGCDITMSETVGTTFGTNLSRIVFIVNTSANVVNFADTAGVTGLAGAFTMGDSDTLTLLQIYSGGTQSFFELARSNN